MNAQVGFLRTGILALVTASVSAQSSATERVTPPTKHEIVAAFGFEQHELSSGDDRITFYLKDCERTTASRLFLFLQGSDPGPQFLWRQRDDEPEPLTTIPGDHRNLKAHDCYAVVEKAGMEGVFREPLEAVPQAYHDQNSLDDRVTRADATIDHLVSVHPFEAVIVYGHSEGAPVAAKLATRNANITHLGFWAGSVLGDFYDFTIQTRASVHQGGLSSIEAQQSIDEALDHFASEVVTNPSDTQIDAFGYTNQRWMSFAQPPLYDLLSLDIPIFMQVATDDESAPIDSTYIVPLEFARLRKTNLDYRICYGCDHGFRATSDTGDTERRWSKIFDAMLNWVDTTSG